MPFRRLVLDTNVPILKVLFFIMTTLVRSYKICILLRQVISFLGAYLFFASVMEGMYLNLNIQQGDI